MVDPRLADRLLHGGDRIATMNDLFQEPEVDVDATVGFGFEMLLELDSLGTRFPDARG